MKKYVCLFLCLALALSFCGCGSSSHVTVSYGSSAIYSRTDMDKAIRLIQKEYSGLKGQELRSIYYSSDAECTAENLAWLNEIAEGRDMNTVFTQCIMFYTDFHTTDEVEGSFSPNQDYTLLEWWFAREENGTWQLITSGYA